MSTHKIEGKLKILGRNKKHEEIISFYLIFCVYRHFYCDFVKRKCPCLVGTYQKGPESVWFCTGNLPHIFGTDPSLIISKHKGIKFHFYADYSQVYIHLSQKNASAAFEKLNRCLDDAKEWMSISKLKLNPDKTEFIIFGSKRQRDKLKACFLTDILGNSLCPVDSVKIWVCGLILTFLCPSMFRMSTKVVLLNSVISDMSGDFLLMMFLCCG